METADIWLSNIAFIATEGLIGRSASHLPGSAHLELVEGVVHLEPERAAFEAMLDGWATQQQARFLRQATIERRVALVRRMAVFTGQYPWEWLPGEGEAFITQEYLTDPRYGWPASCQQRFGTAPQQLFHQSSSVVHVSDYEGQPGRRPLSYSEVQALFDAADRGSPPKRRTVLTVPEMDWIVAVLEQWTSEIRPLFSPGSHAALWVTERRGRLSLRGINCLKNHSSSGASAFESTTTSPPLT